MAKDSKNPNERPRRDRGVLERPKDSGIWWAVWYDQYGHKRRKKCGPKRLALQFRAKMLNEVFERQHFPDRFRRQNFLVSDAIDDYLARKRGTLRSLVNWERYAKQWKASLAGKSLRQVVPGDVERYAARLRTEGLSDASVNRDLTFLRSVFNMAIEDGKADANPVRSKFFVKENNQRLLALIDRLLDFSRIETGRFRLKRELISMDEVIKAAEGMMRPLIAKKNGTLVLKLEARNVNFMGDREKMLNVFVNLIENAVKFSKPDEPLKIGLFTSDAGDFLKAAVVDNGLGIEESYLEKIFNKFYQIEGAMTRKVGGVGLGLTLVREIIGQHNGKVWAESAGPGKGAKFIFTLPVAEKV